MNYIQKKIGGKLRGLKFNQGTDIEFFSKNGSNTNAIFRCYALVWAALVCNCFVKGEEVDFTFENVCDWCEELPETEKEKFYLDIMDVYKSVHKFEEDLPKEENDDKKKLNTESTESSVSDLPAS